MYGCMCMCGGVSVSVSTTAGKHDLERTRFGTIASTFVLAVYGGKYCDLTNHDTMSISIHKLSSGFLISVKRISI